MTQSDATSNGMVEIRLFFEKDRGMAWQEKAIDAYLPTYISGEHALQNVDKRLRNLYFRNPSDLVKIRWNFKGHEDGYWLVRTQEYELA